MARGDIASLAPEVRDYDPALALDGGADGLDGYRAIAADARRLLAPDGKLIVELGMGQEPAVRALFTKAGLTVAATRDDLAGIPPRHNLVVFRYGERRRPPLQAKNIAWNMARERLASAQESTREGCIAWVPGASGSVWQRRNTDDSWPMTKRRLKEAGKRNRQIRVRTLHRLGASQF